MSRTVVDSCYRSATTSRSEASIMSVANLNYDPVAPSGTNGPHPADDASIDTSGRADDNPDRTPAASASPASRADTVGTGSHAAPARSAAGTIGLYRAHEARRASNAEDATVDDRSDSGSRDPCSVCSSKCPDFQGFRRNRGGESLSEGSRSSVRFDRYDYRETRGATGKGHMRRPGSRSHPPYRPGRFR